MSIVQNYTVTGLSCAHCERAVADELASVPGVDRVDVDAQTGRLAVTLAAPVPDAAILAAVDEAGYHAERA